MITITLNMTQKKKSIIFSVFLNVLLLYLGNAPQIPREQFE